MVTKDATQLMKPVHHRSPVIVDPEDYDLWLRAKDTPDPEIFRKLTTRIDHALKIYEVSCYVNNARHDREECIRPAKGHSLVCFRVVIIMFLDFVGKFTYS